MLPKNHPPGKSSPGSRGRRSAGAVSSVVMTPWFAPVTVVICVSLQMFQVEEIGIWRFRKVKRKITTFYLVVFLIFRIVHKN